MMFGGLSCSAVGLVMTLGGLWLLLIVFGRSYRGGALG